MWSRLHSNWNEHFCQTKRFIDNIVRDIVETLFCFVLFKACRSENRPMMMPPFEKHNELWKAKWMNVNYRTKRTFELSARVKETFAGHTHTQSPTETQIQKHKQTIHSHSAIRYITCSKNYYYSQIMCYVKCAKTIYMTDQGQFKCKCNIQPANEVESMRISLSYFQAWFFTYVRVKWN